MADTNLMKNYSVLFPMTISGVSILLFCLGEVLHLLEMKRQQNIFIMLSLLFKALYKNKKIDVAGSHKEEVTHGGPI